MIPEGSKPIAPGVELANDTRGILPRFFNQKPEWFIPKPIENYDVWKGKPPQEYFHLFIDRQTGELFITAFSM